MTIDSGTCGANLNWVLNDDYSLVISGTGAMTDFDSSNPAPWSDDSINITSISLPSGLTKIGDWAFDYCRQITRAAIPDSVTSIGNHAFNGCTSLTSVHIPNSVTSIGDYAFNGCTSLSYLRMSETAETIGKYAFMDCSSLATIDLPASLQSISEGVFYYCTNLVTVIIPSSVTSIGRNAFSSCSNLTSIVIPNSVGLIGEFAFSHSGLTSITIPASVVQVDDFAFAYCADLVSISFKGQQPSTIGYTPFALGESTSPVTAYVYSPNNWASTVLDGYKNEYTTFIYSDTPPSEIYKKLTYDGKKIQVDSAIRDEDGVRIKTNYVKTANLPSVSVTGGAAETGKYVSSITASGHTVTVTKEALPSSTIASASVLGSIKVGTNLSIDASTGVLSATVPTKVSDLTNDSGFITGTGNTTGSSGSCTGNSATATTLGIQGSASNTTLPTASNVTMYSGTILSQAGVWIIETYLSGNYGFQRATSLADPSSVCVRTRNNSATWGSWTYSYAVWKV